MENLNEKFKINKEMFIEFINKLSVKRGINIFININIDDEFDIIKKLNKILVKLKLVRMCIGINVLDSEIENLISLDKTSLSQDDIEKLFIYFYFYNSIEELLELPELFTDERLKWQFIKQILNDTNLVKRYSYVDGELYMNKE